MYKKGMTKTKFKNKMRNFWTDHWPYERTPETWVEMLYREGTGWTNLHSKKKSKDLIESAIDKLVLEKKLTKEKGANVLAMVQSPDKENALVALHIMAQLKPKKFKKVIYE